MRGSTANLGRDRTLCGVFARAWVQAGERSPALATACDVEVRGRLNHRQRELEGAYEMRGHRV